ncbi:MAG: PaaI family thioesterase [Actinomycetota bacterium]
MSEDNPLPAGVAPERAVEMANQAMQGTLMERMGIEWLEVGSARLVARMPVAGNAQVDGLLHGGATATLCETVGSFGTAVAVGLDRRVVGIQLSVNHLRAVGEGHVTCAGVPVRVGRRVAVWDLRVRDDREDLVATATLTVSIQDP